MHEVWQVQQVLRTVLALELFAPLLDGVWAAHVEQRLEDAARAYPVRQLFMPGAELICLDEKAGVKDFGVGALDDGLGVHHDHVMELWQLVGTGADFKPLQQLAQDARVAAALLVGGWNAVAVFAIAHGKFAMGVDFQVA